MKVFRYLVSVLFFASGIFGIINDIANSKFSFTTVFALIICLIIAFLVWPKKKKYKNNKYKKEIETAKSSDVKVPSDISFKVATWGQHADNIKKWQAEFARDNWANDPEFKDKSIYHYAWKNDVPVRFVPEPENDADDKAVAVYLNSYHIGYVPRPINSQNYSLLISNPFATAQVHGGDRKYKDEYGDVIKKIDDPIVEVLIPANK